MIQHIRVSGTYVFNFSLRSVSPEPPLFSPAIFVRVSLRLPSYKPTLKYTVDTIHCGLPCEKHQTNAKSIFHKTQSHLSISLLLLSGQSGKDANCITAQDKNNTTAVESNSRLFFLVLFK